MSNWDGMRNYRIIYHSDKQAIVDLFVGKSVTKIADDELVLSDGTLLQIFPNFWIKVIGKNES